MSGLRLRSVLSAALLTAATAGAWVTGAAPAAADDPESTVYVNLGDSFSAGTGVMPMDPTSPERCARSARNYAHQLAERNGYDLTDVSCGGAKTQDFTAEQHPGIKPQLDALGPDTDLVTLTIGGNDGDVFGTAVRLCTEAVLTAPRETAPCTSRHGEELLTEIRENTAPALDQAVADIRAAAPNATVVVVGYPWLLPPTTGCFPAMPIAAGDVPFLRDLQTELNESVEAAAVGNGALFADMSVRSEGRDACAPIGTRWVEPIVVPVGSIPVHPNEAGERAMADAVVEALA